MKRVALLGVLIAMLVAVTAMAGTTKCESSLRFVQSEQFTLSVKGCTSTQLKVKAEPELPKLRRVATKDGEEKLVKVKAKQVEKSWILNLDQGSYEFVILKPYPDKLLITLSIN